MSARRWIFGAVALLMGALTVWSHALRLPFLRMPVGDGAFYLSWGESFPGPSSGPFWFAPGYAAFLALLRACFGAGALPIAVSQVVILALAVTLTVSLAERWFGRRAGWITGLLFCGSAGPIFLVTKPLPDLLALLLALVFVALALETGGTALTRQETQQLERLLADGAPRPRATRRETLRAGLTGVAGGAAALVYPWIGYAVVASGLSLLMAGLRGWRGRAPAAWFLLGALMAVAPSTFHNARAGALAFVQTGGGFDAWLATVPVGRRGAARSEAVVAAPPLSRRPALADSLERVEYGAPLEPGHRHSWWSTRALRNILESPGAAAGGVLERWRRNVAAEEPEAAGNWQLERSRLPWLNVHVVPFPALLLLGLLGLRFAAGFGSIPRGISATLTAPAALLCAALIGLGLSPDAPRGRIVILPLLALFGGHALVVIDTLWGRDRRRGLLLVVGLVAGTALLWRGPGDGAPGAEAAALYLAAGNGFEAAGSDSAAEQAWREALVLDPARVEASLHLSQLALRRRDLAGAIAPLESAVEHVPRQFDLRNNLGILYYQALRYDDSERELTLASRLRPREPGPWFYLGLIAQKAEHHAKADSLYATALGCDPRFPGAWIRRVENQLAAGNPELARSWADSAAARGIALPAGLSQRLEGRDPPPAAVGN